MDKMTEEEYTHICKELAAGCRYYNIRFDYDARVEKVLDGIIYLDSADHLLGTHIKYLDVVDYSAESFRRMFTICTVSHEKYFDE